DLEAVELDLRSTLHQAGTAILGHLLDYPAPTEGEREVHCHCGTRCNYLGLREKEILTVLGPAKLRRPYFLLPRCGEGQFPVDRQLDVERNGKSPGVRRMLAVVGQQMPFEQGRQHIKLLADLEITTKEVERTAESIGKDVARREQEQIHSPLQL